MSKTVNETQANYNTNLPAIIPQNNDFISQNDVDNFVQSYANFAHLTTIQLKILIAIVNNLSSEYRYTDGEIAENLGIHRNSIVKCRQNPSFAAALAYVVREIARGQTDNTVKNIQEQAKTNWKAAELLLRYTGEYIPASQQAIISAHIHERGDIGSVEQFVDGFILRCGTLGMDRQRILDMIAASYDRQRSEGAF